MCFEGLGFRVSGFQGLRFAKIYDKLVAPSRGVFCIRVIKHGRIVWDFMRTARLTWTNPEVDIFFDGISVGYKSEVGTSYCRRLNYCPN